MANVLLSAKAVGSVVKLKVNGTAREFIVVHQGKPSSIYDDSCNGTWLLMKDCYVSRAWHRATDNKYESSDIHTYLNSTFLNLLDSNIKGAIKQVKLPYRKNGGSGGTTQQGANGLSCKIFLLSAPEVHYEHSRIDSGEGAALSYFASCATNDADPKRVAYLNGSAASWWLPVHPRHQVRVGRQLQRLLHLQRPHNQLARHPPRFGSSLYALGL